MSGEHHPTTICNRRDLLRLAAAAGLGLACPATLRGEPPGGKERRPNIVLIFTDDQGYYDLGVQGHPTIATPRIDSLAAAGTRFTDFYVAGSICIPSRFAMMTGAYPDRKGAKGQPLLPELLKAAGYATALVGKWHLGSDEKSCPTARGFDQFFGTLSSNNSTTQLMRGTEVAQDPYDNDVLTATLTAEALRFIDAHHREPFFLYLAHNAPHWPIPVGDDFKGKSAFKRPYGDSIEEIDWSVGQVLDRLDHHGLREDTLVIYTSDNGPRGNDGGAATPYRGRKWSFLDGGQRVPCLMRWPGRIPAGRTCAELASTLDFLPTFTRLAGKPVAAERVCDGYDNWDLYRGEAERTPWTTFYYYGSTGKGCKAIRSGRWKYFVDPVKAGKARRGKPGEPAVSAGALFDLRAGPDETEDLAAQHPGIVARFRGLVEGYHQAIKARRPVPVLSEAIG